MKNTKLRKLILSAMFIAIGMVLPFLTGQIKEIGSMLLPMHIPVMLCGLICGPWYGLAVGLILPILRSFAFGMPAMYPSAIAMAGELAAYGGICGAMFYNAKWKCLRRLYLAMVTAMLGGRAVWGAAMFLLLGVGAQGFTFGAFIAGAFTTALPGIVLQLLLIPSIMLLLKKTHLMPFKGHAKHCYDE